MRHSVPHRNNIGVEPLPCKSFLGRIGPRGRRRLDPRGQPGGGFCRPLDNKSIQISGLRRPTSTGEDLSCN